MPTISVFYGITIQMYWRDHAPPHFHAYYQGFEALIDLENSTVIAGSIPSGARRIVVDWARQHQSELLDNWERGRKMLNFILIPGADAE